MFRERKYNYINYVITYIDNKGIENKIILQAYSRLEAKQKVKEIEGGDITFLSINISYDN